MACFAAPAAAAIVTTVIKKKIPAKYHVDWLMLMLYGGTLMLIVDHIANKEIVPYYPFFTDSWSQIWPEILKVGVPMTGVIFAAWAVMVLVTNAILKKKLVLKEKI